MRKMRLFFGFTFFLLACITKAQVVYLNSEYGFALGGTNYYGDINQQQNFNYLRYSGGLFFKYHFNDYISLKLAGNYGKIGGSDKFNKTDFEKKRNLSFENDIYEVTGNAEFNFLRFQPGNFDYRWTPYLNLGLGGFRHDPYAYFLGKKYKLKPLGTEGQNLDEYSGRKYSNYAMVLNSGIGVKYWMRKKMSMGFEIGYRFTNTDYLDDVSTTYVGAANFPVPDPPPPYPFPAVELQDRSNELGIAPIGKAGRQRGIRSTLDQYLFAQVTMSFRLAEYQCPD